MAGILPQNPVGKLTTLPQSLYLEFCGSKARKKRENEKRKGKRAK